MHSHGLTLWTDRPDAKALLASCAKNPPKRWSFSRHHGLTSDHLQMYRGKRAEQLAQIRELHLCLLSGADWDAPNPDASACRRYCDLDRKQPTVEAAIDSAVAAVDGTVQVVSFELATIADEVPPRVGGRKLAA